MKLSNRVQEMLHDPRSHIHTVELTDEYKNHLQRICGEMMDELVKRTHGPGEALMVLSFLTGSLEESSGMSGFTISEEEAKGNH